MTIRPALLPAALTPIDSDGRPDPVRLAAHIRDLVARGCAGVALFGTTGEGPAFSVAERIALVEGLLAEGIEPKRLLLSASAIAREDVVALCKASAAHGLMGAMVKPLSFFRDATQEGLFRFYEEVIERTDDPRLALYLYNIPQFTGCALGLELVASLAAAFPETVEGVKDSSADLPLALALIERLPELDIYVGAEEHLPAVVAAGGAGGISGMANVMPERVAALMAGDGRGDSPEALAALDGAVQAVMEIPFVAALKAILALRNRDSGWMRVRAPLVALDDDEAHALQARLSRHLPELATSPEPVA